METAEKMPLPVSPKGIAEAMDLPDNHSFFKASINVLTSRKVESEVPALVEEPDTSHLGKPITAYVKEPVTARVENPVKVTYSKSFNRTNAKKGAIDTAPPIESVKDAVNRFGGSVDWKAHRAQNFWQRPKSTGMELEMSKEIVELRRQHKFQVPEDLYSTNKLIEELKQNLERAQREGDEAAQGSEAARLKVEELEEEIANEARYAAALSDLNSTKVELKKLHKEYASMVIQKDVAVKMAEESIAASKEVEKSLTCLTTELESLELARIVHLGAVDNDCCNWKLELQHAADKLQRLNQQVLAVKDLKSKLEASSSLLLDLKSELAAYVETKLKQEGGEEQKQVLEEVKATIEQAIAELNSVLTAIRRTEEKASVAVASLMAEVDKMKSQIASVEMKRKEAKEKMNGLPKKLEQAEQEADHAKSLVQAAQIELREAKEEAEQAKARASAIESRLLAAESDLEDAKYYEKLASEAIKALQESESAKSNNDMDSPSGVTLGLEEYYELRKQAHEAEKQANLRVAAANSQIEMAKDSESNSLIKFEEVNRELAARRESLKMATEKAEKAQEGKLGVERELSKWKADQEQQRNASFEGKKISKNSGQTKAPSNNIVNESAPETKSKKKKKQLFPRVAMFFAKRKARRNKSM